MSAKIRIEYGVAAGGNGFIPLVRHAGKSWNWLRSRGVDYDQALEEAQSAALDEAARYTGDWTVTISHHKG